MNCSSRTTENRHANGIRLAEKKNRHLFGPCSSVKNESLFLLPGLHNKWEEQARFKRRRKKRGLSSRSTTTLSTYILTAARKNYNRVSYNPDINISPEKVVKIVLNLNVLNYSTVGTRRKTCF